VEVRGYKVLKWFRGGFNGEACNRLFLMREVRRSQTDATFGMNAAASWMNIQAHLDAY